LRLLNVLSITKWPDGTARTYAELLGDQEGAKLLALTLDEERETDQKLSELAKSTVNVAAAR
jgi:ferritin-like metal-binding protein YciE